MTTDVRGATRGRSIAAYAVLIGAHLGVAGLILLAAKALYARPNRQPYCTDSCWGPSAEWFLLILLAMLTLLVGLTVSCSALWRRIYASPAAGEPVHPVRVAARYARNSVAIGVLILAFITFYALR